VGWLKDPIHAPLASFVKSTTNSKSGPCGTLRLPCHRPETVCEEFCANATAVAATAKTTNRYDKFMRFSRKGSPAQTYRVAKKEPAVIWALSRL